MNKVQLEAKLESLTDEINFLRHLYEEVRRPLIFLYKMKILLAVNQCALEKHVQRTELAEHSTFLMCSYPNFFGFFSELDNVCACLHIFFPFRATDAPICRTYYQYSILILYNAGFGFIPSFNAIVNFRLYASCQIS